MDQWSSSADMIRIRATVERALLMHRPEGIVSLAVPITRVKAIQEAIAATTASGGGKGGLSRLKRIEFYEIRQEFSLEDVLSFLGSLRRPSSPSSSLSSDVAVDARTGTMLLKEIKIGGPSDYGQIGKRSLYTILQALGPCLQTIDLTDWRGAVMDLDQIPTDQVEVLHLRLDRMVADSCDIGQFLKRSRKLKDLQICIGPGHRGLFQWAVEKKRREIRLLSHSRVHDREQQDKKVLNEFICEIDKVEKNLDQVIDDGDEDSSDDSTGDNDGDDDEDNEDQEDPLDMQTDSTRIGRLNQATKKEDEEGLQNLSLAGETPSVLWGLLGATSAFYDRLQVMKATSWMHQRHDGSFDVVDGGIQGQITAHGEQHGHESEQEQGGNTSQGGPPPILPRLYWSAMMTRLVHLELKGEIASLSFDMRSLAQCPVLQRLRLDTYVSDINPDLDRIPEMLDSISSTVCELELMGPWFVTDRDLDRMGRGGVLPRLRTLRLSHCRTWRSEITERAVVENREEMVDSPIPTRIQLPDYLQAAMPLQQDISPSEPISSRTRSRTSSQLLSQSPPRKQKKNRKADTPSTKVKMSTTSSSLASGSTSMSASTPKSGPTPSDKYLSPKGLVKAVEQMTDLHFLYIGISKAQKGSKQRSWLPFEAQSDLLSSEGAVVFREAEKAKEDKQDMELYLDEKSLMEAFKGSVGEVRAFPLEVEIMECI
ncbi:hypothetical protein FBU30_008999 [Linnemannia zychae]|nr:hypothetical protein FBU30_008999 [Linnemannia zychae]